jgi:hypothetical protein
METPQLSSDWNLALAMPLGSSLQFLKVDHSVFKHGSVLQARTVEPAVLLTMTSTVICRKRVHIHSVSTRTSNQMSWTTSSSTAQRVVSFAKSMHSGACIRAVSFNLPNKEHLNARSVF